MNNLIKNGNSGKEKNRFPLYTQTEILAQPYYYITQIPLPTVWEKLPEAFNEWLNIPEKEVKEIEDICQIYQYGNLILDDIQDGRLSRDGIETAHSVYGMAYTINAYFYCFVEFQRRLSAFNSDKIVITESKDIIMQTCLARATRLQWRDTTSCPTEEEYYQMIIQQTYLLLTAKIKLMQLSSKNKQNFVKLCGMLGLYFQILSDYRHLSSTDEDAESYCEDLTLRKFSLPIIHVIKTQPQAGKIIFDMYRRRSKAKLLKTYLVSFLQNHGGFQYTKTVLEQLKQEILTEIEKLGPNSKIVKFMEEYFEPSLDNEGQSTMTASSISYFIMQMDQPLSQDVIARGVKQVLRPAKHYESLSANSVGRFVTAFRTFVDIPKEKFAVVQFTLHAMQTGVYIVDDIQDFSELRRGLPCAHLIFGIANTLNAATYVFTAVKAKLLVLNELKALAIYQEQLQKILYGQGLEIYWRDNFICPSESEYIDMISGKTGAVFVLIGKLIELFSTTHKNYDRLMSSLGEYFQISDDYHNLTNKSWFAKKGFCDDLSEGKFGFPVIHAVQTHPKEGQIITDILRQRTSDVEIKKQCLSLLEKCDSFDYTKKKIKEVRDIIVQEITNCGASMELIILIEKKFSVCDM